MSLLNQGFPQPLVAPVALAVAQASARPITGAFGTGAAPVDAYAANSFSPDYVADFSAASADYFRVAGSDSDFATAFTSDSEGGGPATMADSSGNLVWRPHNLLTYSANLSNAAWTKSATNITAGATAPDGSTSDRITHTNTSAALSQSVSPTGGEHTAVFWVKYVDNQWFRFLELGPNNSTWFDVQNGVVGTEDANHTATITAGDGGYYCSVVIADPSSMTAFYVANADADGSVTESSGTSTDFWGAHFYRSDLGGMADNPDAATGLEKYVPTTTAARYLARRRHHRWDGSAWVPTCLHEPVGATNVCLDCRELSGAAAWTEINGGTTAANAVGIDGVANSAYTITDPGTAFSFLRQSVSVSADSNPVLFSCFVKKTSSAANFPGIQIFFRGGTQVTYGITIDTDSGAVTERTDQAASATPESFGIIDWSADYWLVYVGGSNNGTNTSIDIDLLPAIATSLTGVWSATVSGSAVFDCPNVYVNEGLLPSSPIITAGSTVTRTADTLKGKAASLPYSATAMSMAWTGRGKAEQTGQGRLLGWGSSANRIIHYLLSGGVATFLQGSGAIEQATAGSGVSVPTGTLKTAARFVSGGDVQTAVSGAAGAAESATTPSPLPAVSGSDLVVGEEGALTVDLNQELDTIRLWDEDIAEAGIEEATS